MASTTDKTVASETPGHFQPEPVRCKRCKRPLRSAVSAARRLGDRCAAIEAALEGLSAKQQEKALELIAVGGVQETSHKGVYRTAAFEGDAFYLSAVTGQCSCKWGLHRKSATVKTCHHVAAARLWAKPVRRASRRSFAQAA